MTMSDFPPGLVLIIGAFLLPIIGQRLRPMLTLGLPLLTLYLVWSLPNGTFSTLSLLDYNLAFIQSDSISRLFATVFSIMTFGGSLFALKQKRGLRGRPG